MLFRHIIGWIVLNVDERKDRERVGNSLCKRKRLQIAVKNTSQSIDLESVRKTLVRLKKVKNSVKIRAVILQTSASPSGFNLKKGVNFI